MTALKLACYTRTMQQVFSERWFKISSPIPGVKFVVLGRDALGWKLDVYGHDSNDWPDGDTYQDSLEELLPFLGRYVDATSIWADYNTGEQLSMLDALLRVTGKLP